MTEPIKTWQERVAELDAQSVLPASHEEVECYMIQEIAELRAALSAHDQDWSRFHHLMAKHRLHPGRTDDDLIDILTAHLDKPVAQQGEPVAWQYRMRASWQDQWQSWCDCSKEAYENMIRVPLLHDWHYEARALFTHPAPVAEMPNIPDDLDMAKAVVRASGYSLVSRRFIVAFGEFVYDYKKGDFDLPKLAEIDLKACFDAWQEPINHAEVEQAAPREPMTDEQIRAVYEQHTGKWLMNGGNFYLEYARGIEAFHGIKEKS